MPEGVLDQLGHLGLARRRYELDLVDERPVEPRGEIAVALGQTPDDLRGLGDVVELATGVDAFGRVREREVASRAQTRRLQDRPQDLFGRSGVRGRFEDDERARFQGLRDGASGALDEPEVGAVIGERCRNADQDDVATAERRSARGDPQPGSDVREDLVRDVRDVRVAFRERVDAGLIEIDAHASEPGADDRDEHRQADVSETDDPHLRAFFTQRGSELTPPARPGRALIGHRGKHRTGFLGSRGTDPEPRDATIRWRALCLGLAQITYTVTVQLALPFDLHGGHGPGGTRGRVARSRDR